MRFSVLLPMCFAAIGFVLALLCLFSGSKPGFMEEYHIITLNTSSLGENLLSTTTTSSAAAATSTGFFTSILHNVTSTIEGDFDSIANDIGNEIADKLAAKLGIEQWYSLHLMDMCEGTYTPNATSKGAKLNVSSCSNETALYHFNIDSILGSQLELGPLHINLTDINWPTDIQSGLNKLSAAFDAITILYFIGIACSGLAIITAFLAFLTNTPRLVSFGNLGLTSFGFLVLLIASIIITVVQVKAAHIINKYGNEIGVYAYKGGKFLILTWVSVAALALASLAWIFEFIIGRKRRGREFSEKKTRTGRKGWFGSRRHSDEANLRRSGV